MPKKFVVLRVRFRKKLRFPIYGDMEPTSLWECKSNMVTLWWFWPQITPGHWQKLLLSMSFQELKTPRGSWVIIVLNISNNKRSVSLFTPTTKVASKPNHQRRIKAYACMHPKRWGWWKPYMEKYGWSS